MASPNLSIGEGIWCLRNDIGLFNCYAIDLAAN
jgi:hypothetical protein